MNPIIRVQHPDTPGEAMIINESDFDPHVHTRVEDAPTGEDNSPSTLERQVSEQQSEPSQPKRGKKG